MRIKKSSTLLVALLYYGISFAPAFPGDSRLVHPTCLEQSLQHIHSPVHLMEVIADSAAWERLASPPLNSSPPPPSVLLPSDPASTL